MQFNLTPAQILSYLTDLEEKINREYKVYLPSVEYVDVVSDELLNTECQRMLDFVGMSGYKADARFAVLRQNAVGETRQYSSVTGVVEIQVSEQSRSDWKVVLATMAHEIAHHVIFLNGIRPDPEKMHDILETYTDLCSIYIGFGKQILDEAEYLGGRNNGYLTPNTFKLACHMVAVVCGGVDSTNTGLSNIDPLLDDAIELWESDRDKTDLMKKMMLRFAKPAANAWTDIEMLEQLLTSYRNELKERFELLNKDFYLNTGLKDGQCKRPMAAFDSLYNHNLYDIESNESLDIALFGIFEDRKRKGKVFQVESGIVCPICGKRYKRRHSDKDTVAVKCSECGTVFAAKVTDWNPTTVQHRFLQRAEERNRIHLEELKGKMIKKLELEYSTKMEELNAKMNRELDSKRTELQTDRLALDGREHELVHRERMVRDREMEIVLDYVETLPSWLRWIVKCFSPKGVVRSAFANC